MLVVAGEQVRELPSFLSQHTTKTVMVGPCPCKCFLWLTAVGGSMMTWEDRLWCAHILEAS
eukprot:12908169-Prorocentrum_lima.AAC.1